MSKNTAPAPRKYTANPLRIGFISPMHYPAQPPFHGGAEATSWMTCELLARHGHDVYLFQRGNQSPPNVTNIQFDAPTLFDHEPLLAGAILRFAEQQKLDILINTSWIDCLPAAHIMGYGPPMLHWLTLPANTFEPFTRSLERFSGWSIGRSKIFAQTHSQALGYREYRVKPESLRLPVPLGAYAYQQPAVQQHGDYFLWAGRPLVEKGPDTAIRIAIETDTPIKLYCSAQTSLFDELQEMYKDHHLVTFIFQASPERIVKSMHTAKAVLMPNRAYTAEGQPREEPGSRVIMESLLQGCPIIGTENGSLVDWVREGQDGFLADVHSESWQITPLVKELNTLNRQHIQQEAFTRWSEDANYRRIMDAITQVIY